MKRRGEGRSVSVNIHIRGVPDVGWAWELRVSGARIANGSGGTFEGASYAAVMEARLHSGETPPPAVKGSSHDMA